MFKVYSTVNELPPAWDEMMGNKVFLSRKSLMNLAILNSCHQTYHIDEENRAAFVNYKMYLNLFKLSKFLSIKVPINVTGVPMTVSTSGYFAESDDARSKMVDHIKELGGLQVILNADEDMNMVKGNASSECVLEVNWNDMEGYLSRLRSSYRRRVKQAMNRFQDIEVEELSNNCCFDQSLYDLYEETYNNLKIKLEKMHIKFFKNYPSKIFKFTLQGKPVAFIQFVENNNELIFLFGGYKQELNRKYDLYMNMLLKVIQYGTENGFKHINLGQAFGETKVKLGAYQNRKYIYVHHNNPILNFIINTFIEDFSYKGYDVIHRVFKQ